MSNAPVSPDNSYIPGPGEFRPDAEHINALPDALRRYIHDLQTRADPAGDTATIWSQREQIGGLLVKLREAEQRIAELEGNDTCQS